MTSAPPPDILTAFGVSCTDLYPLDGGQGRTWRAGDIVLKPTGDQAESAWRAELLTSLEDGPAFQVARPVRSVDGPWTVAGWEAWHAVDGREDHRRPDDVLHAGAAFHAALASVPRPPFLNHRENAWTRGDRMAWEEIPLDGSDAVLALLEPLAAQRRPVDLPSQAVHGDLLGNVLFARDTAPVIIDWAVYHRPPEWAAAVVVCDAMAWFGASADLVHRWSHLAAWRQMLIRALIYRIATDDALAGTEGPRPASLAPYRRLIRLAIAS